MEKESLLERGEEIQVDIAPGLGREGFSATYLLAGSWKEQSRGLDWVSSTLVGLGIEKFPRQRLPFRAFLRPHF